MSRLKHPYNLTVQVPSHLALVVDVPSPPALFERGVPVLLRYFFISHGLVHPSKARVRVGNPARVPHGVSPAKIPDFLDSGVVVPGEGGQSFVRHVKAWTIARVRSLVAAFTWLGGSMKLP